MTAAHSSDLNAILERLPFLGRLDPAGKRAFVRADFNVPIDEYGALVDDGRLRAVLPTINYLLDRDASVVVGSHIRNPLAESPVPDQRLSFAPLARRLSRLWEVEVTFCPQPAGPEAAAAAARLRPGQVLLLENLRFHPGETAGDEGFARLLADLADLYVNDAFGVCHRLHASMTVLPGLMKPAAAGFALRNELKALNRALSHPARPLAAIIGGRSIESKLPVVAKLMGLADYVLLGGRMGDAFSRLAFGRDIARLELSAEALGEIELIMRDWSRSRARIFIPWDVVALEKGRDEIQTLPAQLLSPEMISEDIGPATRLLYSQVLAQARTIIWNGPMGAFETPAFARGTAVITKALAQCQGVTLAGGVDTSAAIVRMSDRSQVSFLSTGGSAFLKALAGQPLAALEALLRSGDSSEPPTAAAGRKP